MPNVFIDSQEVDVEAGATILQAARRLGLDIPTLCHYEGLLPSTSCLACVVKVRGKLVPSCATVAVDGMEIESETEEVHNARRMALELLLSDHVGDCLAPCHTACPAQMDIPRMMRYIQTGQTREALMTVKEDIALPGVLGYICTAPCEGACRRRSYDRSASICLLKRHVAEEDLASETPYLPKQSPVNGKRIAVVGTGPTGLSAAYYLLQWGYECVLFDEHEEPGGNLRYAIPGSELPREVLDGEIGLIRQLGAVFQMNTRIGDDTTLDQLRNDFDAVLMAVGELEQDDLKAMGMSAGTRGIKVDPATYQTSIDGVFAAGNAIRRRNKLAVRSAADGKAAALAVDQFLIGHMVGDAEDPFNIRIGRVAKEEVERLLAQLGQDPTPALDEPQPVSFSVSEAQTEAQRCLHCDCRAATDCKLRIYAQRYHADPRRFAGERRELEQSAEHPEVLFEPGKCITCGICIQIASKESEELGLTFIGRGFDVKVGVPFSRSISEGLRKVAVECVAACPTGALTLKVPGR